MDWLSGATKKSTEDRDRIMHQSAPASKKVVIMQPTYLPWLGYFDLIDQADIFVFLDMVQFEKQSWQQRNRIRSHKGLEWVTVPTLIKGRFGQLIKDVEIREEIFVTNHLKQMAHNYQKAKAWKDYCDDFSHALKEAAGKKMLCRLNIKLIEWLCSRLQIRTQFVSASELDVSGKRSELLVSILKRLGADIYISPQGSAEYLQADYAFFQENGISIFFQDYNHPEYEQSYKPFVPFASVIDLLFNQGQMSREILLSGRRQLIPFNMMVAK